MTLFVIVFVIVVINGVILLKLMLRYGKALNGPVRNPLVKLISVPKSYFTHFYIFSSIYVPSLLLLVLYYYTNHIKVRQTSSDLWLSAVHGNSHLLQKVLLLSITLPPSGF